MRYEDFKDKLKEEIIEFMCKWLLISLLVFAILFLVWCTIEEYAESKIAYTRLQVSILEGQMNDLQMALIKDKDKMSANMIEAPCS
jgi:hypothetical protein